MGERARYAGCTELAGPVDPTRATVAYRALLGARDRAVLSGLLLLDAVFGVGFGVLLVRLVAGPDGGTPQAVGTAVVLCGVVVAELGRMLQTWGLCAFALAMRDPVPMAPAPGVRVAVLTTVVPSREPVDLLAGTLRAMCRVRCDDPVDVWVLDEEDDPRVRLLAAELGVRHFSRRGHPRFNTRSGAFRARTKAGNHNAWRACHGAGYDVVAQVDPDHVPAPEFLARTLGYFRDPDVAFVVAPQVYGNVADGFVARAAAAQGHVFTGVVQRGGNGFGAPLLIGTNHLYRMAAWDQVGGYQDSLIEDHLTGMVVHATVNPRTGRRWTGVYTPDVLAVGEGPATWADYFGQQTRWAYGVWQVLLRHTRALLPRLSPGQRLAYLFLQSFYPALGAGWLLGNLATVAGLVGLTGAVGTTGGPAPAVLWASWCAVTGCGFAVLARLRRWYLHGDERRGSLRDGVLITLAAAPVYAAAAVRALRGRALPYAVTPKGRLRRPDRAAVFAPHLAWAAGLSALLATSVVHGVLGGVSATSRWWAAAAVLVCVGPVAAAFTRSGTTEPECRPAAPPSGTSEP